MKGWTALFGGQVHSSGIGGLKSRLKDSLETAIPIERAEFTTRECYACGKRHELSLSDREFKCSCGWSCDRDRNAVLVVLKKGLGLDLDRAVGLDRPELKPPEKEAAVRILGSNLCVRISFLL